MLNFASLIVLISGQNPRILAGRREASDDCLCIEISFLLKFSWAKKSRENTKDEVRRMTRERKKRKRRERRLHKENVLLSALQIKKDRFESNTVAALARWPLIGQLVAQDSEGIEPITEANNIYI